MVILKSKHEIEAIRKACQIFAECHRKIAPLIQPDTVAELDGWLGDSAWSYAVGKITPAAEKLIRVTKECLDLGIEQAQHGNRLGDVTNAIQRHAESNGFGVVRDLLAHGIGRGLHEEPNYMHFGKPGKGLRIKEGMVFTIEPMITEGTYNMTIDTDGWTASSLPNTSIRSPSRLKVSRL